MVYKVALHPIRDRSLFIPQGGTEEKLGGELIFETSKRLGEKKDQ